VFLLQADMINEATLMAQLSHRHIVCMVGICQADNIMLVLELAPLGPLNKYLKNNRSATATFFNTCSAAGVLSP